MAKQPESQMTESEVSESKDVGSKGKVKKTASSTRKKPLVKKVAKKRTATKKAVKKTSPASPKSSSRASKSSKDNKKKATVLVTGAAGSLARQVIKGLRKKYNIVAVDFRRQPKFDDSIPSYAGDMNKRQFEDIFRKHEIDGVIHLGRMESNETTPERRYNANVLGTQRLLNLCVDYKIQRVVVLSTFFVYGASPYNPALLNESAPLKAVGLTKDLVDSVELENLANVFLWKHPDLNMTILRPCHIAGPKVKNSMSLLLSRPVSPVLAGFSPMMQFVHLNDMARAIELAFAKNVPGIYNIAPKEWMDYGAVLEAAGCRPFYIPSIPPAVPKLISRLMRWKAFPAFLIDYFKYSVVIDGSLFEDTFDYQPEYSLEDILGHYRTVKQRQSTTARY
ncbi:MAG: NAD-dependent epimerase/dehydratase family protein [Gammaproteobacteria bacterium]